MGAGLLDARFLLLETREALLQHDLQNRAVGFDHSLGAQGTDVLHGLLLNGK